MKTYIVDWGKRCNGGRYALIQAQSLEQAWLDADVIGCPFRIMELKIPARGIEPGLRYMEFDAPKSRYAGARLDRLRWKKSCETGAFA